MKASEIITKVTDEKACVLIRHREPITKPYEYDVKGPFVGNKKGWTLVDLFTANAMLTIYKALSETSKPKFDLLPFAQLVNFTWKNIK